MTMAGIMAVTVEVGITGVEVGTTDGVVGVMIMTVIAAAGVEITTATVIMTVIAETALSEDPVTMAVAGNQSL
jgi:hypothetical protein